MPKLLFELALFFRSRLESLWVRMIADWVISKAREEYIDFKIIKHKRISAELVSVLERERERRHEAMLRNGPPPST